MALSFSTPLDVKRPYGSFRFDVFSLKADRRMTLYGKAALCQFIELESDFEVTAICERPLLIPDIKPKRQVDFWALNGGIDLNISIKYMTIILTFQDKCHFFDCYKR